jgi:hypothetical protein
MRSNFDCRALRPMRGKAKIVMAITEILRALVHFNWATSPADMPVGF